MTANHIIAAILILLASNSTLAQNIFPETFEGCDTEQFAMEHDTVNAKINSVQFLEALNAHFEEVGIKRMMGSLQLQIIVDMDGNSCLLSIDNETNVRSKKLQLKQWIDTEMKWSSPTEKVAAIVVLEFTGNGISMIRLGIGGSQGGWHVLD